LKKPGSRFCEAALRKSCALHRARETAVIASEVKQSGASRILDCFVARAPRNDGGDALLNLCAAHKK